MVKAVEPEQTNRRTDGRTDESEFIGSFRSLKTSGEPINHHHHCSAAVETMDFTISLQHSRSSIAVLRS